MSDTRRQAISIVGALLLLGAWGLYELRRKARVAELRAEAARLRAQLEFMEWASAQQPKALA